MKWIPLIATLIFALWPLSRLRGPSSEKDGFAVAEFAGLPVRYEGRLQPFDSLARNALLQMRKKQTLNLEPWKGDFDKPKIISAADWLLELMIDPAKADTRPCFRIDNSDLKGLLNLAMDRDEKAQEDGKHYRWAQIEPHFADVLAEAERAGKVESQVRSAFERSVLDLAQAGNLYRRLKMSFGPAASGGDLKEALSLYRTKMKEARDALDAREAGQSFDSKKLDWLAENLNAPLVIPPADPSAEWSTALIHIRDLPQTADPHPVLASFNGMVNAWKAGDKPAFARAVEGYRSWVKAHPCYVHVSDKENGRPPSNALAHASREQTFNHVQPFYAGMVIAVFAFLALVFSWFDAVRFEWSRRTGVWLLWLVFSILTLGILFRMVQEWRPPVTNLYSSALLIGWGSVLVGLLLEMVYPRAIGALVAAILTFGTLLVAHFLSLEGDTMIMLQAVLDTNFWLATHVVIVTLGYAATFVAGILGIVYVFRAYFTKSVTKKEQRSLAGMAFGIVCFATLFSFVGTVLGGLWADQSWGRFWGWDPKENGALMIVIWNAIILHARLGGMVRERGLLVLCVGGNIITSWSWFGTNMLGIGLHSYGFMDAAKWSLIGFIGFNLLVIFLGWLPQSLWTSSPYRDSSGGDAGPTPARGDVPVGQLS